MSASLLLRKSRQSIALLRSLLPSVRKKPCILFSAIFRMKKTRCSRQSRFEPLFSTISWRSVKNIILMHLVTATGPFNLWNRNAATIKAGSDLEQLLQPPKHNQPSHLLLRTPLWATSLLLQLFHLLHLRCWFQGNVDIDRAYLIFGCFYLVHHLKIKKQK